MKIRVFLLFIIFSTIPSYLCTASNVHQLVQDSPITFHGGRSYDSLQIYCYKGKPKYIVHIWQTITLLLESKNENYAQYDGHSPEDILNKHAERKSSWTLNLFTRKQKHYRLDPFNQSCIGIDSSDSYTVYLNVMRMDYWKIFALILGIFLFFSAEKLSQNTLFYYICGVSLGITASFLILIYFISKLFPRRPMMYGVAICGWAVGVYILQMLLEHVRTILDSYRTYVLWYIFITGLVSFIVCYRWGPVTNKRTKDLIKWSLQCFGIISVFFSSEFQEAAMGQIILMLFAYYFPKKWVAKTKAFWKSKFPPKVKLLSNDEYYQEGVKETTKALEELRDYCSSPKCNQWKTVLKLKDVKRFASFIEGTSHLSDDEILEYETSMHQTELTDDEAEENALTEDDD